MLAGFLVWGLAWTMDLTALARNGVLHGELLDEYDESYFDAIQRHTHPKTNMAMEHPPYEDVFPIEKLFSIAMLNFGCVILSFKICLCQFPTKGITTKSVTEPTAIQTQ